MYKITSHRFCVLFDAGIETYTHWGDIRINKHSQQPSFFIAREYWNDDAVWYSNSRYLKLRDVL